MLKTELKLDKNITYKPYGNNAILIEWNPIISEEILNDVLQFKYKIEHQKEFKYCDLIVGYNSLTIQLHQPFTDFDAEKNTLKSIYSSSIKVAQNEHFIWEIPVCYDVEFGIDIQEVASKKGLTIDEVIDLHSEKTYTVFFIGFLPGFLYLGGLNEQLFIDRKPNPRLKVSQGAVAIGGQQTGVYPVDSPGGWNIIGKTPIPFFNVNARKSCFAKSGDYIKFKPISLEEYIEIKKKVKQNNFQISKTLKQ